MRVLKSLKLQAIAAAALLSLTGIANATLLVAPGNVAPSPTASPAGAALIADTGVVPFTSIDSISFAGSLRTQVWTADPSNPFGPGCLTFTYVLSNTGPDPLEQLSTVNFQSYSTDVNFSVSAAAGVVPFEVTRNGGGGKILGWQFDPSGGSNLAPGLSSATMVVFTNATSFIPAVDSVIDGSVASVASYGPSIFPEPTSLALLSLGVIPMLRRRR